MKFGLRRGKAKMDIEKQEQLQSLVEGLLLVAGEDGIDDAQFYQVLMLTKEQLKDVITLLQQRYEAKCSGIELSHYGGRYRLLSKAHIQPYLKLLFQAEMKTKLSSAALETLAIIAYKQPITRVEIEEIRGVSADVMLHKLEAYGFVHELGRSDAPGKPILYGVTNAFMDAFQLEDLQDLPALPEYQNHLKQELFGD